MPNRFDTTSDDFDRIVDAVEAVDYLDTQSISGKQFRDIFRLLSLNRLGHVLDPSVTGRSHQ